MGEVDADIGRAHTLPSRYYTDSKLFTELMEHFQKQWSFAAHRCDAQDHNVLPLPHIEAQTGEPVLLTIHDDEARLLSGVCTHRGMILADKPCNANVIQCPYHGRTFGLDGCLRAMPGFEGVEDFPSEKDHLTTFDTGEWNGFFFASLVEQDFATWFAPFAKRMSWWPDGASITYDPSRHRDHLIEANWIAYVDNYLEGFHIPFVHGDLHATLDHDEYHTELFAGSVLQIGIAREGEPCFDLPSDSVDYGKRIAAYYWWFFPGLMLNVYPWGLSVNIIIPESVNRTRVAYHGYVTDPSKIGIGAGGDLDKVELEDQAVVTGVQRGMNSATYDRGRYSPKHEAGVHHFHRMLSK